MHRTSEEKLIEMNKSLIADNNYLRARLQELTAELADRSGLVCGDCDGSGWLEDRVEGRYACTCMTEAEPYQLLLDQIGELNAARARLADAGKAPEHRNEDPREAPPRDAL